MSHQSTNDLNVNRNRLAGSSDAGCDALSQLHLASDDPDRVNALYPVSRMGSFLPRSVNWFRNHDRLDSLFPHLCSHYFPDQKVVYLLSCFQSARILIEILPDKCNMSRKLHNNFFLYYYFIKDDHTNFCAEKLVGSGKRETDQSCKDKESIPALSRLFPVEDDDGRQRNLQPGNSVGR